MPPRSAPFFEPRTGMVVASVFATFEPREADPFIVAVTSTSGSGGSGGLTNVSLLSALRCRFARGNEAPFSSEGARCLLRGLRVEMELAVVALTLGVNIVGQCQRMRFVGSDNKDDGWVVERLRRHNRV